MPVIINEFEVIAEPPEPAGAASPAEQGEQPAGEQPLRPVDIIRIQEYYRQRMERLAAD